MTIIFYAGFLHHCIMLTKIDSKIGVIIGISIVAGLAGAFGYWEYQQVAELQQEKSGLWTKIGELNSSIEGWKAAHHEKELLIQGLIEEKNALYSDNANLQSKLITVENNLNAWHSQYDNLLAQYKQLTSNYAQQQSQLSQQQRQAAQQAQQAASQEEKDYYIAAAQTSAPITGIIKGYLNIYIEPLPYYADASVANAVSDIENALNGKTWKGIPLHITTDTNQADIRVQWVRDYGPNPLGETIFGKHIQVGLGASFCGSWEPLNAWTVNHILWHELGHTFGYGHSSDPNNVMYATTPQQFVRDTDVSVFLANGYYQQIYFCNDGINAFQISTDNQNAGFDTYVALPNTNPIDVINGKVPYYDSCSRKNMASYSNTCTVAKGSYLIVNNPYRILGGNNQYIHVTITEENARPNYDMNWDPTVWTMSQQEYDHIWSLFHSQ